jgi:hypothetical protein
MTAKRYTLPMYWRSNMQPEQDTNLEPLDEVILRQTWSGWSRPGAARSAWTCRSIRSWCPLPAEASFTLAAALRQTEQPKSADDENPMPPAPEDPRPGGDDGAPSGVARRVLRILPRTGSAA